jgi:D-3-phosphoglycerate dehydrogenase
LYETAHTAVPTLLQNNHSNAGISRNTSSSQFTKKCRLEKDKLKGTELAYKTLGLLVWEDRAKVAQIAKRGFDMEVIGHDIRPCLNWHKVSFKKEVIAKAIQVSTGGKEVIIGEKELCQMKKTAYLINTSRGGNARRAGSIQRRKEGK